MTASLSTATVRQYDTIIQQRSRPGCPCHLAPTYQVVNPVNAQQRRQLVHNFTTMQLCHMSRNDTLKNALNLDAIHHELECSSLVLRTSGSSNILVASVSFDCLITDASEKEHRQFITFDLKIPGMNTDEYSVFPYEAMQRAYGSKKNLYKVLQYFYDQGRAIVNPNDDKHGTHPDYNPSKAAYDQYIRHTEQLLVAYLALPEAATMLSNRLRAEIRGEYPNASSAKVYNMGLHMHSTKTCCAPCEYSLIGLMNVCNGLRLGRKPLSFLTNFQTACAIPNDCLTFTLPQRSSFRLLVTISASKHDKDHRKQPSYVRRILAPHDPLPRSVIHVKDPTNSQRIFTTMLGGNYDRRRVGQSTNIWDKTVVISGSLITKGSPLTIKKVRSVRTKEVEELAQRLSFLEV